MFFMFQVAWTDQWNTLLTLDDRRIIDDSRISIERPYTRDWNLHIRKSEYNDRGQYTCQINTNPVKMKTVMLLVLGNHYAITHVRNTNSNIQGRSPNVVKEIFHTIRNCS